MKRRTAVLTTLFWMLTAAVRIGMAADTVNTDVAARVNEFGDGTFTVTFRLSASQWENWREQYGDHPDLLRRDLRQRFAKFAFDDFKLERNDMERTAVATIGARALTTFRSGGIRAIEIDKQARFVSSSGSDWIFEAVEQASPYSPIVTETTRVALPPQASNAHMENRGSGSQFLVYQMPESGEGNDMLFWLGIAAIVFGVFLGVVGLLLPRKGPPAVPQPAAR